MEKIDISIVNTNFHIRIFKILFGEFSIPEELQEKIINFNANRKETRRRLFKV